MAKEKTNPEAVEATADAVGVTSNEATPKVETPAATDYSKYASMAETPSTTERRVFDYLSVSGKVDTETIVKDGEEVEKRKPATAYKLLLTKPAKADGAFESEEVQVPFSIVPIKYRVVMEHRTGSNGEILVLKSSEFNGKMSDLVTVSRFSPDGKVTEKYGPMTVAEARQTFQDAEGKGMLRDKAHVYGLYNGEIIRFVVKGAGLWEKRSELSKGKTAASKLEHPYLTEYLSTFPMTEPYFLYEMKVDAAYRDHMAVKFYRPIFERGTRISADTEKVVIEALEDLHKYFQEQDKATAEFVATSTAPAKVVVEGSAEEKPF
jgi:hypothetical protein